MLKINLKNNFLQQNNQEIIDTINTFELSYSEFSGTQLRNEIFKLQNEYTLTNNLKKLITRSFALTREVSKRSLGLRHFDVQLLGGLVLNTSQIAEMKTGEGKTLVATLPAILNALTKDGVHIVTVNSYLANRDQVSMGQIYRYLGFDTGLIKENMSSTERQINYNADITYVTNYELTFDFLRDNLAVKTDEIVLRPLNYCIIDEVDSVLIDEAQVPIILSGSDKKLNLQKKASYTQVEKYVIASELINYLNLNEHFELDEKNRNVILTNLGSQQIQNLLQIQELFDRKDPWIFYIINSLRAHYLYFNNTHYIIQNNQIVIVDEFTGRIMPDRRWGDGLHQAIEAKEKLPIQPRTGTKASITYQNFFLMYPKLSGMTGTAKTSQVEFDKIYNLKVETIPTFKSTKRKDLPDLIYKDQFSKWNAIAKFCNKISYSSQPMLIGTTTVEKSEMLAQLLTEYKLTYDILNAKPENLRRESEIIAQAGKKNAITIATNMAGRGTDIILGGNINFKTQKEIYELLYKIKIRKSFNRRLLNQFPGISHQILSCLIYLLKDLRFLKLSFIQVLKIVQENERINIATTSYQSVIRFLINEFESYNKKHLSQENIIVKNLGGLYVIGTERNDSRRIDNQLRGRCGRQGDPGTSRFFLSLDDHLLRLFGGKKIQQYLKNQMNDTNSPLESSLLVSSLDSAQQRVEERAYEQRKNLFEYDDIVNKQRSIIYFERYFILTSKNKLIRKYIYTYAEQILCGYVNLLQNKFLSISEFFNIIENSFQISLSLQKVEKNLAIKPLNTFSLKIYILNEFWIHYQRIIDFFRVFGKNNLEDLERLKVLQGIDKVWKEHLDQLILLKNAVGWRGYAQRKPITEYKQTAYSMFSRLYEKLISFVLYEIFKETIH